MNGYKTLIKIIGIVFVSILTVSCCFNGMHKDFFKIMAATIFMVVMLIIIAAFVYNADKKL